MANIYYSDTCTECSIICPFSLIPKQMSAIRAGSGRSERDNTIAIPTFPIEGLARSPGMIRERRSDWRIIMFGSDII